MSARILGRQSVVRVFPWGHRYAAAERRLQRLDSRLDFDCRRVRDAIADQPLFAAPDDARVCIESDNFQTAVAQPFSNACICARLFLLNGSLIPYSRLSPRIKSPAAIDRRDNYQYGQIRHRRAKKTFRPGALIARHRVFLSGKNFRNVVVDGKHHHGHQENEAYFGDRLFHLKTQIAPQEHLH